MNSVLKFIHSHIRERLTVSDTAGRFGKAFLKEFGCLPAEYRRQVDDSRRYYEKRRVSMFQLSGRCSILREEAFNRSPERRSLLI